MGSRALARRTSPTRDLWVATRSSRPPTTWCSPWRPSTRSESFRWRRVRIFLEPFACGLEIRAAGGKGDTLVVETTNFAPYVNFLGSGENLRLVERFSRTAADTVTYEVTLNDPTTWTKPWTVVIRLKQSRDRLFEYACHEGNSAVMSGMLLGARAQER